jgi:hypothetical protein
MLAEAFQVQDEAGRMIPVTQASLAGNLSRPNDNPPGTEECLVRVEWLKTVSASEAIREKGFFGNQNSVDRLKARFEIPK